jgi:hypothetical protein
MQSSVPPPGGAVTEKLSASVAISGRPRPAPGLSMRGAMPQPSSRTITFSSSPSHSTRSVKSPPSEWR